MRDLLPGEVLQQPKAGFAAPVDYWLTHDLKEMVDDLLSPAQLRKRGMFQPSAVDRFVREHRSGRQDWSMQVWQFLTLELWMQTFLDGGAEKFESEHDSAVRSHGMKQVLQHASRARSRLRRFQPRDFFQAARWYASRRLSCRLEPNERPANLLEKVYGKRQSRGRIWSEK